LYLKSGCSPLFSTVRRITVADSIVKAVEEIAGKVAWKNGLELAGVEFVKEGKEKFLRIYIYKKGGVSIDDCVAVHKEADKLIDELLDIPGPYIMEVSSPGYERAFKTETDYRLFMGEEIEVKLYKPVDGLKKYTGKLKGYENGEITVVTENGEMKFKEEETAKVNRVFRI
jgi:ribosome maturation factor RimP